MEGRASGSVNAFFSLMCVGGYESANIWAGVMAEVVIKCGFCANILECKCGVMHFSFKIVLPAGFDAVSAAGFKCSYCNLFLI